MAHAASAWFRDIAGVIFGFEDEYGALCIRYVFAGAEARGQGLLGPSGLNPAWE